MKCFPLCVDLKEKTVFLVGNGPQIRDKAEKLQAFGARLIRCECFTENEAKTAPSMVIAGDIPTEEAESIYELCCRHRIPVNVVDVPRLCSFYFPALITRGDLTVSVSTGGSSPAVAAYLRKKIEEAVPEETEQILDWICRHRAQLKEKGILKDAVAAAFDKKRPLTAAELCELTDQLP